MADRVAKMRSLWAVPLSELMVAAEGEIAKLNRWWVVCDEGALFFGIPGRYGTPQCNTDRQIVDSMAETYGRGCRAEFVPLAFVPFSVTSEGFELTIPAGAVEIGGIHAD